MAAILATILVLLNNSRDVCWALVNLYLCLPTCGLVVDVSLEFELCESVPVIRE